MCGFYRGENAYCYFTKILYKLRHFRAILTGFLHFCKAWLVVWTARYLVIIWREYFFMLFYLLNPQDLRICMGGLVATEQLCNTRLGGGKKWFDYCEVKAVMRCLVGALRAMGTVLMTVGLFCERTALGRTRFRRASMCLGAIGISAWIFIIVC